MAPPIEGLFEARLSIGDPKTGAPVLCTAIYGGSGLENISLASRNLPVPRGKLAVFNFYKAAQPRVVKRSEASRASTQSGPAYCIPEPKE